MDIKEKVTLLVGLQEKDLKLNALRLKAAEIPAKIEEEKTILASIKAETEEKKKSLQKFQVAKKERELELDKKESDIRKHSSELNSIKSNDSYRALLVEIENGKKGKTEIENQILDIMESIEKEAVVIKENEKVMKAKEAESGLRITSLQEEQAKIEAEVSACALERDEYAKKVPADLLSKYEYISESRQGLAVVPIEGENCGGCQIVLRPQIINDVHKNADMVLCDSCSRILYKK